jgi:FkbM family methyltransferase
MPLNRWLLRTFRDAGRYFGLDVRPNSLYSREDWRVMRFLQYHKIDTVLDVGANRGQFAAELFRSGFKGRIISFEALPHVYEELRKNASAHGDRWVTAPRCALSDEDGTVQFYVTNNLVSSSMLSPSRELRAINDDLCEKETIRVTATRLDGILPQLDVRPGNILLKLDVQGCEKKVLDGARESLPRFRGVLLEMSLQALYEAQPLAGELDEMLLKQGFQLWDIVPVYRDAQTGRLMQYDGIYFRTEG